MTKISIHVTPSEVQKFYALIDEKFSLHSIWPLIHDLCCQGIFPESASQKKYILQHAIALDTETFNQYLSFFPTSDTFSPNWNVLFAKAVYRLPYQINTLIQHCNVLDTVTIHYGYTNKIITLPTSLLLSKSTESLLMIQKKMPSLHVFNGSFLAIRPIEMLPYLSDNYVDFLQRIHEFEPEPPQKYILQSLHYSLEQSNDQATELLLGMIHDETLLIPLPKYQGGILHTALPYKNQNKLIESILQKNIASLHQKNSKGDTPLHVAIRTISQRYENINTTDTAYQNLTECIALFIQYGANVMERNHAGARPIDFKIPPNLRSLFEQKKILHRIQEKLESIPSSAVKKKRM